MANELQGIESMDKTIVLNIISGYGFSLIKGVIEIHATLSKNKLQTPKFPVTSNDLKVASELKWYLDNATLKKLRMSNSSIKIECFHVPYKSCSNEKLGYLLLNLKEAQTINSASNDYIKSKSYKLIGSKNCSYSITLSLRIEDNNVKAVLISPKQIKNGKLINNKNKNKMAYDSSNHIQKEENKHFGENIEIDANVNVCEQIEISSEKNQVKYVEENEHIDENMKMITNVNVYEQTENSPEKSHAKNVFTLNAQQKIIEELENWKDQQMILFNEKMKMKEDQLLNEMSKCKILAENLDEMADKLKERDAIITAKELELASHKDSMDKYIGLLQNLQSSNTHIINELNNKVLELQTKLLDSKNTNNLLRKENDKCQLKDANTTYGLKIQQLEETISNLESKCDEANKSCMFFKERWIASVRKINQMYSKHHGSIANEHILNNRLNIHNILNDQIVERQHDEENLKKLLNDLSKLRQDITKTSYLDS